MKQLAQEQLGSMLFSGEDFNYDELRLKIALGPMFYEKVSLYVYDSDSKESLKQFRAFFYGIEARHKCKLENIEGLIGGIPSVENDRVTRRYKENLCVFINMVIIELFLLFLAI